jgi:hypothetical protein
MEPGNMGEIIPSRIEEIEKDMNTLRQRLQETVNKDPKEGTEIWIRGWRKCDTTWSTAPIGVSL